MKELDKAYDAQKYEDDIYTRWEESGFFNPDNLSGEPFTIVFPHQMLQVFCTMDMLWSIV